LSYELFEGHYVRWSLGEEFFKEKTLLEVGAGHGHIGAHFAGLGAEVTCSDGRREHVITMRENFNGLRIFGNDIKVVSCDLDIGFPRGDWDIIVHMGVLYHLRHPVEALHRALHNLLDGGTFILESEVVNSDDPDARVRRIETGYDQAIKGKGVRLSAAGIEKVLDQYLQWERFDDPRLNSQKG
jgi:2-polyprenyl-3-methyl-5-hydroxy-6-metoxy-1,4-benzoquinol methylase